MEKKYTANIECRTMQYLFEKLLNLASYMAVKGIVTLSAHHALLKSSKMS